MATTDTTFFTNEEWQRLIDRFKVSLRNNTKFFDVVVWYFRASWFFELYEELENVEKIRILVWLDTDATVLDMINKSSKSKSTKEVKDAYSQSVKKEFEEAEDDEESEKWVLKFIEFIKSWKLEIRAYAKGNIHSKVYIIRKDQDKDPEHYWSVITWSSNFSLSWLKWNLELNVELKDKRDVDYALDYFNELWKEWIDVTEEFVSTVQVDTHFNDTITPYELYLKFLYEYFWNLVNQDKIELALSDLPEWYTELEYQKDAVKEILQKVNTYWGVFLADVVWLWKTIVCCLMLKYIRKKALIICPPSVKAQRERDLFDFNIWGSKVESLWMLQKLVDEWTAQFDYVFVDEAHRFRNEETESYSNLSQICQWKKVILISATPFNNNFNDLKNLVKLFHPDNLPWIEWQLDSWFEKWIGQMKKVDINKDRDAYKNMLKKTSSEMREMVLKHLMVRRTRADIVKYYKADMESKGLFFPNPDKPQKIAYEFDLALDNLFNYTIETLKNLTYSRYNPSRYLSDDNVLVKKDELQKQRVAQNNIVGFMKTWLVKRLESSFYAFKLSIWRIKESYEKFIKMYNEGDVYVSKKFDIYDLLENDLEKLIEEVDKWSIIKYPKEDLTKEYKWKTFEEDLQWDLELLEDLCERWENITYDPKIRKLEEILRNDSTLRDRQLIIFSESKETVDYLKEELSIRLNTEDKEVYWFSWTWNEVSRDFIRRNFDPNSLSPDNTVRILVTTDVLAEWINLHKSNVIINYDIPRNPTRVLQRFWRVNRVWTKHNTIHIYNFFPTKQWNEQLDFEKNIIAKMDAFLSLLWWDAQHLTEAEEIGSKTLFEKINSEDYYQWWDDELSDNVTLWYLQELRNVRDENKKLFEKVKSLPRKTRTAREHEEYKIALFTFFKKWDFLKMFLWESWWFSQEYSFEDAAKLLKCSPDTPRKELNTWHFYNILRDNTRQLEVELRKIENIWMANHDLWKWWKTRSDVVKSLKWLLDIVSSRWDNQRELIQQVMDLVYTNRLPSKIVGSIKDLFKKTEYYINNPNDFYRDLKNIVPEWYFEYKDKKNNADENMQVILSEYFI